MEEKYPWGSPDHKCRSTARARMTPARRISSRAPEMSPGRRLVEPSHAEVIKSAAMYLALRDLQARNGAQAITIACLGGIPIDVLG